MSNFYTLINSESREELAIFKDIDIAQEVSGELNRYDSQIFIRRNGTDNMKDWEPKYLIRWYENE